MNVDETKLSTELNLALQTPYDERVDSLDLNVGYDEVFNEWELIVRYTGSLSDISRELGFSYTELLNGYAVIRIRSEKIDALTSFSQIIFVEKPKQLYAEEYIKQQSQNRNQNQIQNKNQNPKPIRGFSQSCMGLVQTGDINLTGKGVLVAVIDSGIDFRHPAFIRPDNSSRILRLWDQSVPGNPPPGYSRGSVYTQEDIERVIKAEKDEQMNPAYNILSYDNSGHGTGVSGVVSACVPDADLLVVKLSDDDSGGFPRTTSLMLAIDYVVRTAAVLQLPLVINLSFGNNYGDHNGNSILENYINSLAGSTRLSIAVGMGNDGNTGRHISRMLSRGVEQTIEFQINPYVSGINLQVWHSYSDELDISLVTPRGAVLGPFSKYQEVMSYKLPDMQVYVLNGYPTPVNRSQELYISMIPNQSYIEAGIWTLHIMPKQVTDGRLHIWLPVAAGTSANVQFLSSSPNTTMTIPSSASTVISVGAYNPLTLTYAPFSGRGYTTDGNVKPDLAAPGVDIDVPIPNGGYTEVSGTSFATPFVSAAAAMLMQWGITEGRDPYLYGDKLKSYLIKGARKLPGYAIWPNEQLGWGALCVSDSLPE